MLLWSMLYLTQTQAVNRDYENLGKPAVTLDEIRRFRQIDSKTPGHPEYHWVSGVETTTGPLGQGIATSVGMAIAEKWLASRYNQPGFDIFDYNVYAVCGDGCLMEGIGSEAASLAGHLALDNLCWIYDNNHITIEGDTRIAFTEDVATRFQGYHWNVLRVGDANDLERIEQALETFRKTRDRPTLIILDSHIGYGSPHKVDTAEAHGEPLGEDEVKLDQAVLWLAGGRAVSGSRRGARAFRRRDRRARRARRARVGKRFWPPIASNFLSRRRDRPDAAARAARRMGQRSADLSRQPQGRLRARRLRRGAQCARAENPLAARRLGGPRPLEPDDAQIRRRRRFPILRRGAAGICISAFANTRWRRSSTVLSLSKLRSFGATFFIFSDYARPAIRLSALMELPTIFVFTHDAMGDGEDGPTHQPVEHLISLRAMPGLVVLRPGDANEVVEAYRHILRLRDRPTVIALSRQALPDLRSQQIRLGGRRRARRLCDGGFPGGPPEVILIASGSEVALIVDAQQALASEGIRSRIVSMPSWEIFEDQPKSYRDSVLPPELTARVAVEQGSVLGWERYVGATGRVIGMSTFGASAPLKELQRKFGFEPERVAAVAKELLGRT